MKHSKDRAKRLSDENEYSLKECTETKFNNGGLYGIRKITYNDSKN